MTDQLQPYEWPKTTPRDTQTLRYAAVSLRPKRSALILPQLKVREATSNDPWGPSGAQMNEVAQMTYNQ